LAGFPILRWNAILLGLRKVVPYRRPIHEYYCSIIRYNGKRELPPLGPLADFTA
jgi:hypothetical protein